jgi:hypothetical protein
MISVDMSHFLRYIYSMTKGNRVTSINRRIAHNAAAMAIAAAKDKG